jgi:type II secretory pathway component PulK
MKSRERGAALLLVLAAVAILSVLAVELASRASAESLRAERSTRDAAFRRLFNSGGSIACGLLAEPSRNREMTFTLGAGEQASIRMADESGKINIARIYSHPDEATAIRGRVARLFDYLKKEAQPLRDQVLKRIESRQPLFTLDGLREAEIDPARIFGPDGLSRHLTCFGDGLINLNTAPPAVLYALDPEFDEALVERIAGYRGRKVFQQTEDILLVEGIVTRTLLADGRFQVTRNLYEKVRELVTVSSSAFSASIEAEAQGRRREAWVFLKPRGERIAIEEILP